MNNAAAEKALSFLFPQRMVCHACGIPMLRGEGLLCETCAASLREQAYPPGRMTAEPELGLDFAASAFAYQGAAAQLAKTLKFQSDWTAALPLAEGMAGAYAALAPLREAMGCVAVPSHEKRLRRRGYNQAEVLAAAFAQVAGPAVLDEVLTRVHHQPSQIGQRREERLRNIAGAFAVTPQGAEKIAGRKIILIDDVLTTGATAEECARVLLAAGAARVLVLTACRA